jgi:hypothetical protein
VYMILHCRRHASFLGYIYQVVTANSERSLTSIT